MRKSMRKCTIEEICTSKLMGMPCDRWSTDENCINTLARLIYKEVLTEEEIKSMLYYREWCKVRKAYNDMKNVDTTHGKEKR